MSCAPCAVADREGWWAGSLPRGTTHCSDCHQTWPGGQRVGHCSRCHQTFSGISSFDLHQRVTADGDLGPDCLCSVVVTDLDEESTLGESRHRKWDVRSKTLYLKEADWGSYWGQEAPEVFA